MNTNLPDHPVHFTPALHPAAGEDRVVQKKNRNSAATASPRGTPDSQNLRDLYKNENGYRRNPAP